MFTWICPKCGREVPPAYDECPDCAGKTAAHAAPEGVTAPPPATAPPMVQPPGSATRTSRRPLWATGPQEPSPPPPPYSAPPPAQTPPPAVAAMVQEPPSDIRPPKPVTSPLFAAPAEAPRYTVPQPAGPPKWLLGVAAAVIVVIVGGGLYWFFGRSQTTSAVITAPPAAADAGAAVVSPLQKNIEVTGIRFAPDSKGVEVKFIIINHSDNDVVGLTGIATVYARTNTGQETQVGIVHFQTSLASQASVELGLPLETKLKLVDMPDWQNTSVKVQITGPSGG